MSADDETQFLVVVNHEEQYSIWPDDRELPPGWSAVRRGMTYAAALDHVERVWTDLRPRSARG
ncbi:MAG TPA: MbtH family protein [Actinocrinis sp.]|uniref:MbtH family protein n=1 Tax=Actinocrinis sp. TaxID=1920516 RepID=UPI002DDD0017|nr:MbtH family protein [Actinocrinis sp.]HEV2344117.1 MbtH family protein [Actinocrinis sp.]